MAEEYPRFHHELGLSSEPKTREAILYISSNAGFGQTRLNKALWYADFQAFERRGTSITGQEYQHLQFGPALRQMPPILRRMQNAGEIGFEDVDEFEEQRPVPSRPWQRNYLSDEDVSYLEEAIKIVSAMSAKEASEWAHGFPGWRETEQGETIDYEWVFWSDEPLTEDEIAYGLELEPAI